MKALKIIAMLAVIFTVTGFGLNQWRNVIHKIWKPDPWAHLYIGSDGYTHTK
jgi:hypothetical protein